MTWLLLVIGALATYRATKLVLEDEILADFRAKWWKKWPPESTKRGYLLTCPHCLSIWIGAIIALILVFGGIMGLVIAAILAFSGVTSLIYTLLDR
jgi:hypothetical protein